MRSRLRDGGARCWRGQRFPLDPGLPGILGALGMLGMLGILPLLGLAAGCSREDPDLVARASGWSLRTGDVERAHERLHPQLPYSELPCEHRTALLQNLVNNELLLGIARREVKEVRRPLERRVRSERERKLVDTYFRKTWGEFKLSPENRRRVLEQMTREVHLLRIVPADMASADSCYQALQQGLPFEQAYARYSANLGTAATDMDLGWVTPEKLPHKVARHVFLLDMAPGQVSPPCFTPRGIWIVKALEYAPTEFLPSQMRLVDEAIRVLCYRDTLTARSERLRQSLDFSYQEEHFKIVNQAFNTYWDSLSAENPRANRMDMYSWRVPTWRLAAGDRDLPLFRFSGRTVSVLEFMQSLEDCDVEFWPGGPTAEHRRQEILGRIQRFFVVAEAERLGMAREPEFAEYEQRLRDEALLDEYFAGRIEPRITVTPEDVRAHYEAARDGYRGHEKAAFTVIAFPPHAREAARAFRAAHAQDAPREWGLACIAAADRDTLVVFHRDRGVFDLEAPPESRLHQLVFPVLAGLERDQVSELLELPDGGHALVRCNYRRHAEPLPEEVALALAEGDVRRARIDQKVEQILGEARQSRRVRTWPERLCTGPAAPAGAAR